MQLGGGGISVRPSSIQFSGVITLDGSAVLAFLNTSTEGDMGIEDIMLLVQNKDGKWLAANHILRTTTGAAKGLNDPAKVGAEALVHEYYKRYDSGVGKARADAVTGLYARHAVLVSDGEPFEGEWAYEKIGMFPAVERDISSIDIHPVDDAKFALILVRGLLAIDGDRERPVNFGHALLASSTGEIQVDMLFLHYG